jgi:hypothetical protein
MDIPRGKAANVTSQEASNSLMPIVEIAMGAGGVAQPLIMSSSDGLS